MKKGYISNVIPQEKQDQAKKLYRFISDNARKLDEARGCATCVSDLFAPNLLAQRSKLRENCEKLIFLDPILYGRKGEEMLWRKVYYDIVSTSKRLKKKDYNNEDISHLQCHINAGIGYYHHFISRLEIEHNLNLNGIIDFPINKNNSNGDSKGEIPEWVELSIHRCLIYLGDLTRYKLEIYPNWDPNLAIRYYLQAASFKPEYGMPHNQLGTLSINLNYSLDSTYHYLRCLDSKYIFEGTENNLKRLFEKNETILLSLPQSNESSDLIKKLIVKFLSLVDTLYFEKKRPNLHNFCHEILLDLQSSLNISKPLDSPTENDNFDIETLITPSYLTCDILFKMTVILLICAFKLEKNASNYLSTVKAFLLALYSQLVQTLITKVETSVFNIQINNYKNGTNKKNLSKLRRRVNTNSSESDLSETELILSESSSSENSLCSEDSSEDEDDKNFKVMDPNDLLEIFNEEDILRSIKILSDYLIEDLNILKTCSTNTQVLQKRLVSLLNLININSSSKKLKVLLKKNIKVKMLKCDFKKIPLPEDVILKDFPILKNSQRNIDWSYLNNLIIDQKEDMLVRIFKIVEFGHSLTEVEEIGICYDKKKKCFWVREIGDEIIPNNNSENMDTQLKEGESMSRGALMKSMGQLWLAAEVQNLESRVQQSHNTFSPYLVLDTQALIHYTHLAKQLAAARKFIILIPVTVLSALDELKRETIKARDAIRWLETQFHRGNRFLRAQRAQERSSIPLIKYPKKKDKDLYTFIQIIECCHFLTQQQKNTSNLVTLLTGNPVNVNINNESRDFSYTGLAKSAGVNIELITSFHARWKKSLKPK